jgi:lipopolysaccharide biosynthesis glycosyltransferase
MNIAYTIATKDYLAYTRVAVHSFLENNSEFSFYIFCLNEVPDDFQNYTNLYLLQVEDLALIEFFELREKYNNFELSNAIKPFLGFWLISKFPQLESLIYLDSDLQFFGSIDLSKYREYNIVLTPHTITPIPIDNFLVAEQDFLNTGIYNAGFIIMNIGPSVIDFLNWWKERTLNFCFIKLEKGLFVDQIWLNLVPLYFKNVHIIQDLGYNVAHWNLHERKVTVKNGEYYINDKDKLIFFHFSGFDIYNYFEISKYQNRFNLHKRKDLISLFENYKLKINIQDNYELDIDNKFDDIQITELNIVQKIIAILKKYLK